MQDHTFVRKDPTSGQPVEETIAYDELTEEFHYQGNKFTTAQVTTALIFTEASDKNSNKYRKNRSKKSGGKS